MPKDCDRALAQKHDQVVEGESDGGQVQGGERFSKTALTEKMKVLAPSRQWLVCGRVETFSTTEEMLPTLGQQPQSEQQEEDSFEASSAESKKRKTWCKAVIEATADHVCAAALNKPKEDRFLPGDGLCTERSCWWKCGSCFQIDLMTDC